MTTTVHTITIEGAIFEKELHAAAQAARDAGCTHYRIEQAFPLAAPHPLAGKRWIAAKGRASAPLRSTAAADATGEAGGNPIGNEGF